MRNERWDLQAACIGKQELFFPEVDDNGVEFGDTTEARKICSTCPVKSYCLDEAIAMDQEYGIAGGLNYKERESLKKKVHRFTRRPGFEDALNEVLVSIG